MSDQQEPKNHDNRQAGGAPPPPPPEDYYAGSRNDDYYKNKQTEYAFGDPGAVPAYQTDMQFQPRAAANVGIPMQIGQQQQQPSMMTMQQPGQQAVGQQQLVQQHIQMVPVQRQVQQIQMVPVKRMRMVQVQQPVQRQVCSITLTDLYLFIQFMMEYDTAGNSSC